ncbi:MAG: acyl-CoA thioesterase [Salibacteraceae bacterium]
MSKTITTVKRVSIRFNEVDSLGIVWHGNFVKYLEDGREDFGAKHGLTYLDFKANNHAIPIVKCDIDYKRVIKYGDEIDVETTFCDSPAAKLKFTYRILNSKSGEVIATAKTIQVFTTFDHALCYVAPDFFLKWKKQIGL